MPESVEDRCTKSHEYIFLLTKSEQYFFDGQAISEPAVTADDRRPFGRGQVDERGNGHDRGGGEKRKAVAQRKQAELGQNDGGYLGSNEPFTRRNRRTVWTVPTSPFAGAHFAVFPERLIEPCILAGSRTGDVVFDPFMGAGTVAAVASRLGRRWLGCELNPSYLELQKPRSAQQGLQL